MQWTLHGGSMNFAAYSFNPNDHERSSVMGNFAARSNSRSTCQFSAFMTMIRAIIVGPPRQ